MGVFIWRKKTIVYNGECPVISHKQEDNIIQHTKGMAIYYYLHQE